MGDLEPDGAKLRAAAEAGDSEAMFRLAWHADEQGAETASREWYRRAADAGEPRAMHNLARLLARAGDAENALRLFEAAGEAGMTVSMRAAATLLTSTDPERSAAWLERAANAGDPDAAAILGARNSAANPATARRWFLLAAEGGSVLACRSLALAAIHSGEAEEAERWFMAAGDEADGRTAFMLGSAFEKQDVARAEHWYRVASAEGEAEAAARLARLLWSTKEHEARTHLRNAARLGNAWAKGRLAQDFLRRRPWRAFPGSRHRATAMAMVTEAAEAGDLWSIAQLGAMLGAGGDHAAARKWLATAADHGYSKAKLLLETLDSIDARRGVVRPVLQLGRLLGHLLMGCLRRLPNKAQPSSRRDLPSHHREGR